jgi:TonB family protein
MNKIAVCLFLIFTVAIFAQGKKPAPKAKSHHSKSKIVFMPPVTTNCDWVIDSSSISRRLSNDTTSVSDDTATPSEIYYVEEFPEFPGDEDSLLQYIKNNLTYPQKAKEAYIEGKVVVSFVVTKTGKIKKIKVLRGLGYGCDEEAVRVVKSMPKWKPGNNAGKVVNEKIFVPLIFELDSLQIVDTTASNRKAKPKFAGGLDAVMDYIYQQIRYPVKNMDIDGTMKISFSINIQGDVENVYVVKGLQIDLDSEVVRVVKTLPRFIPAQQNGINIYSKILLTLKFGFIE